MPKQKEEAPAECRYCRQRDDANHAVHRGAAGQCASCGKRDETGALVHLWDARLYCRQCLFDASPTLAHCANTHRALADGPHWPAWRVWLQNFVFYELAVVGIFGGIVGGGMLSEGKPVEALQAIAVLAAFFLIVTIPFSIGAALAYRQICPAVRICNAEVDLWLGDRSYEQCGLAGLEWYVGTTTFVGNSMVPFQKAVFLVFPRALKSRVADDPTNQTQLTIPVGLTVESRERWIAFLTLAGIPRRTLWERRNLLVRSAVIAGGIALLAFGFLASLWVAMTLERNLAARGFAADIAAAITHPIFFPGSFLATAYIIALYPWRMVPRVASSQPPAEQRRVRRKTALGIAGFGLFSIVITIMGEKTWGPAAQATAVAEILVLTALCAFDYSRRLAYTELATTPASLSKRNANP
jgi:hypothetical protein